MAEFKEFPKIPRLRRDCIITEKIDGTNAAVGIDEMPFGAGVNLAEDYPDVITSVAGHEYGEDGLPTHEYFVTAQSRKRLITPKTDNFGFAKWVDFYACELVDTLGPGLHYGEWWGLGIQRGYGLAEKRLSLFNTHRWSGVDLTAVPQLGVVPVLYEGPFDKAGLIDDCLAHLRHFGSIAALDRGSEFKNPEGIVVFHVAANSMFKVTLEKDEAPKSMQAA